MTFPSGRLSRYFQSKESPAPIVGNSQQSLVIATRGLIRYYFANTAFCRGFLALSCIRDVALHTIFSRRDRGNSPYLLTELGSDIKAGIVDRNTIDKGTESAIHSIAGILDNCPTSPRPVIIEDESSQNYLIIEGNKRFSAFAIADPAKLLVSLEVIVGHTNLAWPGMLANHQMKQGED